MFGVMVSESPVGVPLADGEVTVHPSGARTIMVLSCTLRGPREDFGPYVQLMLRKPPACAIWLEMEFGVQLRVKSEADGAAIGVRASSVAPDMTLLFLPLIATVICPLPLVEASIGPR